MAYRIESRKKMKMRERSIASAPQTRSSAVDRDLTVLGLWRTRGDELMAGVVLVRVLWLPEIEQKLALYDMSASR